MLNTDKWLGYIALVGDDRPAGSAEVSIHDYANGCRRQPVSFLDAIWVKPLYRRQGVGRCLVQTIIDELETQGCTARYSNSDIENLEAHDAHATCGLATERVVYLSGWATGSPGSGL